MMLPDLNLLMTLEALLTEGSVAGAARRLRLSPSAMSRSLARLRAVTGDPLLVRAGRSLVPTPRALDLRDRIGPLMDTVRAVLRPEEGIDLGRVREDRVIRVSDGFVETFGPAVLDRVAAEAPGLRLCFVQKPDKDSLPLRDGQVDLEIGVVGAETGPEIRMQPLFRDRFVMAVAAGHPVLDRPLTPEGYAATAHVAVSRRRRVGGPVDDALRGLGLERQIRVFVGTFPAAVALARSTGLVATVPERYTAGLCGGLVRVPLPLPTEEITVSQLWHPRLDADPVHRWLRGCIREVCGHNPR